MLLFKNFILIWYQSNQRISYIVSPSFLSSGELLHPPKMQEGFKKIVVSNSEYIDSMERYPNNEAVQKTTPLAFIYPSIKWQAAICPGATSLSFGISLKHRSVANWHLSANLQQSFGLIGLGISPLIGIRSLAFAFFGSASGMADNSAFV